jgi:hypothetical protein
MWREMTEKAEDEIAEIERFLVSPAGRRLRRMVAMGLIVSAPVLMNLPFMRITRLGRLIGLAGGAALVIKLAEAIRDWEGTERTVIQVEPIARPGA